MFFTVFMVSINLGCDLTFTSYILIAREIVHPPIFHSSTPL